MNVRHVNKVVKCPNAQCRSNLRISIGTFVGGINDHGGWIIRCATCHAVFSFPVKNPNDASSVLSGASVLDTWDDEVGDKSFCIGKHGSYVIDGHCFEAVIVDHEHVKQNPGFETANHHVYSCQACSKELECAAFTKLEDSLDVVNAGLDRFLIPLIKGYASTPEGTRISMSLSCSHCSNLNDVVFYKPFFESSALSESADEFWLIGAGDEAAIPDVDGVFSRNVCFQILDKLLLRWQARYHAVFIIVPFVGLQFPGTEQKRLEHWYRVLAHTRPEKTAIVTRKSTFKLFSEAADVEGLSFGFLDDYGLLNETVKSLSEKNAFFKQDSHAKIYCGMSSDGVEVLNGSFNIHDGEYSENICLKSYTLTDFFSRYFFNLGIWFDVTKLRAPRKILEIRLGLGQAACSLDTYTGSLNASRVSSVPF